MKVLFRVDSSTQIGTGHVMRCLVLAEALRSKGAKLFFVSRELQGHISDLVKAKGFRVYMLPEIKKGSKFDYKTDVIQMQKLIKKEAICCDWVVVDHYGLGKLWEEEIRKYIKRIFVIDDFIDRKHDCDILLNQNLYYNPEQLYKNMIPVHCVKLVGPQFALLRPEFNQFRKHVKAFKGRISKVIILFGGTDPTNETFKVIEAINRLSNGDISADVIVGASNPMKNELKKLCSKIPKLHYHCQIDYLAQLMAEADLAIGAGGTTSWERCCMGLPSLIISVADNQIDIAKKLHEFEAALYLGESEKVGIWNIKEALEELLNKPEIICDMSQKAFNITDGLGVQRVLSTMY